MSIWYAICDAIPLELFHWRFMQNAFLAVLVIAPLFGLMSTMVVSGKMSFFSDALGHSAFTGIAIGSICGFVAPTLFAASFAVAFSLLFSFVRHKSSQTADTLIGVFSSTSVALGIFIATLGGSSFTKYNKYLIGDILSVTPAEIGLLAIVLVCVLVFWVLYSNRLILASVHPQLASSRGFSTFFVQTAFTTVVAVVVTLAISWVGLLILNSLMILPGAASKNIAKNIKQYHFYSFIFALIASIAGLCISYYLGSSAGAAICLVLAILFALSFVFRKGKR